jgi:hypothetical protein
MQDNDIVDTADKWREQEHARKMYELERKHERREKVVEMFTDSAFWGWSLAIVTFLGFMAITTSNCTVQEVDCTLADKAQLEKLVTMCETRESGNPRWCVENVHKTFCRVSERNLGAPE